jgi:hypothetical protein
MVPEGLRMKHAALYIALLAALALAAAADSVYDLNTLGRDVIPSTGIGHLLAGATAANTDIASCYITSPSAAALTDKVVVTVGVVHHAGETSYTERALASLGSAYEYEGASGDPRQLSSATTRFPAVSVIIPLRILNIFTGYFVEKMGRAELAAAGTAYGDIPFDATYSKESSVFSVPIFITAAYKKRLAVSGGVMFSYLDSRESREIEFRSDLHTDITDAVDMYATGTSWAFGALLDYDFVRVGGSFRTNTDMSGSEEHSTELSEIWKTRDVDIAAPGCFKVGASLVTRPVTVEFDYESSPWSKLKLWDDYISVNDIKRLSLGISYTGRRVWNAGEYPLLLGYYRQPLDQRTEGIGETTESGYLAGTSLDIANGRATVVLGLEYITRKTDGEPDLHEEAFGFYISVTAQEAWRRAMKR